MPSKRPNLLLFMPETLRADAFFGTPAQRAQTPNFDAVVAEGAAFSSTYCQSALCSPSRCSMFTGLYPHTRGYRSLMRLVQESEQNLFRSLKEAGYINVAWGKNDLLAQRAIPLGFDEVTPRVRILNDFTHHRPGPGEKHEHSFYYGKREGGCHDQDWAMIESALRFLDEEHDQPFCIYLPLEFAHPPYTVEEPYFSMYDRSMLPTPIPPNDEGKRGYARALRTVNRLNELTDDDFREIKATYYGMITRVDAQLGQLMDKLKERGLYDETAIFYFSDHGDFAGDYGLTEKYFAAFEEPMVHVPLACRIPGLPATGVHQGLVEMIDIYPTILDVAGIQPAHPHFGRSLLPALRGDAMEFRDTVFAEGGIRRDESERFIPPIRPDSPYARRRDQMKAYADVQSRAVMARSDEYKYIYCPEQRDELYDLRNDPDELHNVADDPAYASVQADMKERILRWLLGTSDVLPYEQDSRNWTVRH